MAGALRLAYGLLVALALSPLLLPVPVAVQMTGICLLLIYIGCKNSLRLAHNAGEGEEAPPKLEAKEVYLFPVMGSVVLFSLYLVYKFLPAYWINLVVKAYFSLFGSLVLGARLAEMAELFLPAGLTGPLKSWGFKIRVPFWSVLGRFFEEEKKPRGEASAPAAAAAQADPQAPAEQQQPQDEPGLISGTGLDLAGLAVALLVCAWYLVSNHWLANNCLGMAFSLQALDLIHLSAYFHGFFLLSGLCAYDIFWVFGTDVMVTVARSFDGPIKLLFPQPAMASSSMLGLGDIVIPGIVISLMLKFDHHLFMEKLAAADAALAGPAAAADKEADNKTAAEDQDPKEPEYDLDKAPTPYFHAALVAYTLGLLITLFVMYYFKAAQPALLYLSPAGLISSIGMALARGEFRKLWSFNMAEEAQPEKEGEPQPAKDAAAKKQD